MSFSQFINPGPRKKPIFENLRKIDQLLAFYGNAGKLWSRDVPCLQKRASAKACFSESVPQRKRASAKACVCESAHH